jgi:hypothetical protein
MWLMAIVMAVFIIVTIFFIGSKINADPKDENIVHIIGQITPSMAQAYGIPTRWNVKIEYYVFGTDKPFHTATTTADDNGNYYIKISANLLYTNTLYVRATVQGGIAYYDNSDGIKLSAKDLGRVIYFRHTMQRR